MQKTEVVNIRAASAADAEAIHALITALASYEQLEHSNCSTVQGLRDELEAEDSELEVLLAEHEGAVVGMITFFRTYSTFAGRRGIYLEDLFVLKEHRQKGVATKLMKALGALAVERGYARIEWTTLLWNSHAIEFFQSLGAAPSDSWTTFRLDGEWLEKLAADA